MLGGEERFALAVDLRQYLGIQPVGLFLCPVLRLRRPGIQQAEEGHRFAALAQAGGNPLG